MLLSLIHKKQSRSFARSSICKRIYFRFAISVFYNHIFCFAFSKGKIHQKQKTVSPDLIPLHSIRTKNIHKCVHCTRVRIHIRQDLVHLDSLGPSQVYRPDPWAHIEHPMCSVCVCAHPCTHVRSHPRQK